MNENHNRWIGRFAASIGLAMLMYVSSHTSKITTAIDLHSQSISQITKDVDDLETEIERKARASRDNMKELFLIRVEDLARRIKVLEQKVQSGGHSS